MTGRLHRTWAVMEGRHLVSFHRTEEAARRAARGRSIGFVLRQAGNYEVMLGNDGVPLPLTPSIKGLALPRGTAVRGEQLTLAI